MYKRDREKEIEIGTVDFITFPDSQRYLRIRYRLGKGKKFCSEIIPLHCNVKKMVPKPFSVLFKQGEIAPGLKYSLLGDLDYGLIGLNVKGSKVYKVSFDYKGELKTGYLMRLRMLDTHGDFNSPYISDEGRANAMKEATGIRPFTEEEFLLFTYIAFEQADKLKKYFESVLSQRPTKPEEKKSGLEAILKKIVPVTKIAEKELLSYAAA